MKKVFIGRFFKEDKIVYLVSAPTEDKDIEKTFYEYGTNKEITDAWIIKIYEGTHPKFYFVLPEYVKRAKCKEIFYDTQFPDMKGIVSELILSQTEYN